jgi:hypothetical protein
MLQYNQVTIVFFLQFCMLGGVGAGVGGADGIVEEELGWYDMICRSSRDAFVLVIC